MWAGGHLVPIQKAIRWIAGFMIALQFIVFIEKVEKDLERVGSDRI